MKNNHNVEVFDNGHGGRIAFVFQGARRILNIEQAVALKESLEYGLAKTHLTTDAAGAIGRCSSDYHFEQRFNGYNFCPRCGEKLRR